MSKRKHPQAGPRQAAILTDVTCCIGCEECVAACEQENKLGPHRPWRWLAGDGLSSDRWTTVVLHKGKDYVRKQCRHCLEPACVSVCPVGALYKTPQGAVAYNAKICMGCRYCMMSCPYSIPRYTWEEQIPYIRKCTLCARRIAKGLEPACTEACPSGATIFGERKDLLSEARRRQREAPKRYLSRIFGEKEVGGTAVLYLSNVDLSFLGLKRQLGNRPLPAITWNVLQAVPPIFVGTGALLGGVYWILQRRRRLAELAQGAADPDGMEDPTLTDETEGHDKK